MGVVKNSCQTISHYDELGRPVLKDKNKYNTHDKAVEVCKTLNLRKGQEIKLVTYKCRVCHKYHIGRNGTEITKKYRQKLRDVNNTIGRVKQRLNIKVIGNIDLSVIPKK